MQPRMYSVLLLAVVILASRTTSAATKHNPKSILPNDPPINLYEQFYEYLAAVMSQGIPALGLLPFDPLFVNGTMKIQCPFDVDYNISNINIQMNGLTISDFADFEVASANLSLADMNTYLDLTNDYIGLQTYDIVASGVDVNGRLLQYNCSTVVGRVTFNEFQAGSSLELDGDYLQVSYFILDYSAFAVSLEESQSFCQGDIDFGYCMFDQILDAMATKLFNGIPDMLARVSNETTIILNDIFALRNVTDNDSEKKISNHAEVTHDMANKVGFPYSDIGQQTLTRSVKRSSYQKSAEKLKETGFVMKFNNLPV